MANEDDQITGFVLDLDRNWLKLHGEQTYWFNLEPAACIEVREDVLDVHLTVSQIAPGVRMRWFICAAAATLAAGEAA